MTDLDIQIDVPDDDDLGTSVRVLNNEGIPPWFKAAVVLLVGLLALIMIGAFLLGRNRASDDPASTTTAQDDGSTAIASAEASPAVDMTLEAVAAWEEFARTADLETVATTFDPEGPQYALFQEAADRGDTSEVDFAPDNLTESTDGDLTVVSMDLTVRGDSGDEVFPYDVVYRPGHDRVWTVVDRRAQGDVAVPPAGEVVEQAAAAWTTFATAVAAEDGSTALTAVSDRTEALVGQLAAGGTAADATTGLDAELEQILLDRSRAASADQPSEVLLAILAPEQRDAIATGTLGSWTQIAGDRVVASLAVDGREVTTVPFVAGADGWAFDLAGAMAATGGSGDGGEEQG